MALKTKNKMEAIRKISKWLLLTLMVIQEKEYESKGVKYRKHRFNPWNPISYVFFLCFIGFVVLTSIFTEVKKNISVKPFKWH